MPCTPCLKKRTRLNYNSSNKKLRDAEITAVGRCVYTLMLYTRLASAVAVCIAIRRRYTQLAWLANPNPNPNPTNSSYG